MEVCRPLVKMSVNWNVIDTCRTRCHVLPHKVEVDLDLLRALVLNVVGGEIDGANVVTVDEDALCQRSVELLK
jgi:hypothetical protein